MKKYFNTQVLQVALLTILIGLVSISCKKKDKNPYEWMDGTVSFEYIDNGFEDRVEIIDDGSSPAPRKGNVVKQLTSPSADLTATSIAFVNDNFAIISYHGYNSGSGTVWKGRLEVVRINSNGLVEVTDAIDFPDSRINHVTTDEDSRVFVGLDTKKGPVLTYFQVNANNANQGKFVRNGNSAKTIRVNGISLNYIQYVEKEQGKEYVFSATGGSGNAAESDLIFDFQGKNIISEEDLRGRPGFQKCLLNGVNFTPQAILGTNRTRGKSIVKEGQSYASFYLDGDVGCVQYYETPIDDFLTTDLNERVVSNMTILDGKNEIALKTEGSNKFIYVCAGKEGLHKFQIVNNPAYPASSTNKYTVSEVGGVADEAYSLAIGTQQDYVYFTGGKKGLGAVPKTSLTSTVSQVNWWTLPNVAGEPSVNFVASRNGVLYVAYGYMGIISLDENNSNLISGN